MGNTYFISDTHFYHDKVIKYENRPFRDVEHMNKSLIKNWNNTVGKHDKIFVLGDFLFHANENLEKIVQELNGYKILIMGNHDSSSVRTYYSAGFNEVYKYPIIFNNNWILSHKPMDLADGSQFINIFGHIHSSNTHADYTNKSMCVCVEREHMGYKPIKYEKMKELMKLE